MVSDARLGFGTVLQRDTGGGMVTIVRNVEIGEFGPEADDVETTNHDSTAGFREKIRGLVDAGEASFTGIYVGHSTQTDLMDDVLLGTGDGSTDSYQIVLPGGYGTFAFTGFVKSFKINPDMEGRLECSGVLTITGQPTFAVTASAGLTTPFFTVSQSGVITPAAAQATLSYVVTFLTGVTSFTITPTAAAGVIKVNGSTVTSGQASSAITLGAAGSITIVTLTVTEAAKTTKEYIIRAVRA